MEEDSVFDSFNRVKNVEEIFDMRKSEKNAENTRNNEAEAGEIKLAAGGRENNEENIVYKEL